MGTVESISQSYKQLGGESGRVWAVSAALSTFLIHRTNV
jgi:hypothetical protein